MKKLSVFLIIGVLVAAFGCSKSEISDKPGEAQGRSMSFYGQAPIQVDTLEGQFLGNYEVGRTIIADMVALSFATNETLRITLFDEDLNSTPFLDNTTFIIGSSGLIRASAVYEVFGGLSINATSGSVTINEYNRIERNNQIRYEISGTFSFTDGTESVDGTFNNFELFCLECE